MNKSKKTQKPEEPIITEEDKQNPDPFIRSAAKKIRNINKKISDIETLQTRTDLKPEQQQKINTKSGILEEKRKIEEYVKFYKATLLEAAKDEVSNQLNPVVTRISNALVTSQVLKSGSSLGEVEFTKGETALLLNLSHLTQGTIGQLTTNLANTLNQYLENKSLLEKIESALAVENVFNAPVTVKAQEPEPVPVPVQAEKSHKKATPAKEQVKEQKIQNEVKEQKEVKEVVKQETKQVKEVVTPQPIEPVVTATEQPKVEETPKVSATVETVVTEQTTTNGVSTTQKQNPEKKDTRTDRPPKRHYQNRPNYRPKENNYREGGNRVYRDDKYPEGGYKNPQRDRKYDKPRYQEKVDDRKSDTSLQDSDNEEYKRRKFNNREIKDLQNDGFVVIQKKPKANNASENWSYSRKEHGHKEKANYHYAN